MKLQELLKVVASERICVYLDNGLQNFGYKYLMIYDFEDKNKEVLQPYLDYPVVSLIPESLSVISIIIKDTKII